MWIKNNFKQHFLTQNTLCACAINPHVICACAIDPSNLTSKKKNKKILKKQLQKVIKIWSCASLSSPSSRLTTMKSRRHTIGRPRVINFIWLILRRHFETIDAAALAPRRVYISPFVIAPIMYYYSPTLPRESAHSTTTSHLIITHRENPNFANIYESFLFLFYLKKMKFFII